jgi:hypothetical protein
MIHHLHVRLSRLDSLPRRRQNDYQGYRWNHRPRDLSARRRGWHQLRFIAASRRESGPQYRDFRDYARNRCDPEDYLSQRLIHL